MFYLYMNFDQSAYLMQPVKLSNLIGQHDICHNFMLVSDSMQKLIIDYVTVETLGFADTFLSLILVLKFRNATIIFDGITMS